MKPVYSHEATVRALIAKARRVMTIASAVALIGLFVLYVDANLPVLVRTVALMALLMGLGVAGLAMHLHNWTAERADSFEEAHEALLENDHAQAQLGASVVRPAFPRAVDATHT